MRSDPAIDQRRSFAGPACGGGRGGGTCTSSPAGINFLPRLLLPADLANLFVGTFGRINIEPRAAGRPRGAEATEAIKVSVVSADCVAILSHRFIYAARDKIRLFPKVFARARALQREYGNIPRVGKIAAPIIVIDDGEMGRETAAILRKATLAPP